MTQIEQIKAEIERRMKEILDVEGLITGVADNMRYDDYRQLLSFIESLEKEQQIKIRGWVARDKDGETFLFPYEKPQRDPLDNPEYWTNGMESIFLQADLYPYLTFEDEPIEVELPILRV